MSEPVGAAAAAARPRRPRRRTWLARLALLSTVAAAAVLLAFAGRTAVWLLAVGAVAVPVALAGAWWFVSRRGVIRWLALAMLVAVPIAVGLLYARHRLLWVVALAAALGGLATWAARRALAQPSASVPERRVPAPKRPYLIMNPRSGGGKVARYRLAERARRLGAEVVLLDGAEHVDVAALARAAAAGGADLLGVAGGDGTQAAVAAVAAKYDLPFLVICAGTRNHFALDLGLDLDDPARCLDALTDGVELRVDLGLAGDRIFVNNASFGAYAEVVQNPAYRDRKAATTLDVLPDVLAAPHQSLVVRTGDWTVEGPQAVLVSNNPYRTTDLSGFGRRDRLDTGQLGILCVNVHNAVQAAGVLRGWKSDRLLSRVADRVSVRAGTGQLAAALDGEAMWLPAPVHCRIWPKALRVRVPRQRPGVALGAATTDWRELWRLAVRSGNGSR